MRVVILAENDPYLSYGRPEPAPRDSGLSIEVLRASGMPERLPEAGLLVLPARVLIERGEGPAGPPCFAYGPERLMAAAFKAGARDYLREPWGMVELEARANRLLPTSFSLGGRSCSLTGCRLRTPEASLLLHGEEAALLALFLLAPGEILPRKALEAALGHPAAPASRLLDMRISGLRKALVRAGIPGAAVIRARRGKGYLFQPEACG